MPRDFWADSTTETSRWRTGISCRVIETMKLSTYGTRSLANAANRSDGWVVMRTARATISIASTRDTSDMLWDMPSW